MDSRRRAFGPIAIVAVVLAAWAGFSVGDIAPGATVALGLLAPAAVLIVLSLPHARFDRGALLRVAGAAVLSGAMGALLLSLADSAPFEVVVLGGMLLPAAVGLFLSAPAYRPNVYALVSAAAVLGLWCAASITLWGTPDEGGRTFYLPALWFGMMVTGVYMIFPGIVIAFTWVGLEWRAGRRLTR